MNNIMYKIKAVLFSSVALVALLLASCADDDGNYTYLSDYDAGEIIIDTIGIANRTILSHTMNPGDTIVFEPNVTYKYMERLRYRWFVLPLTNYTYQAVQVGNTYEYPQGDTIAYTKKLDWIVDLDPGSYRFYFMAEDSVTGLKAYYQAQGQYVTVAQEGSQSGLYLLVERDGETDIEIFTSELMLIYGSLSCYYNYYSEQAGERLEGEPLWIRGTHTGSTSRDGYMVATTKNLYRLNEVGLQIMDEWDDMFYDTPDTFSPECFIYTNYCDFLINDGKLHVLYTKQTNDRKFSSPIAGDYEAYPYLMFSTYTSYGAVTDAIGAYQVIFDKKNNKFRPYYGYASSVSSFASTVSDAYVDANNVPETVKAVFNSGGNTTCVIVEDEDGSYNLYRYLFYNVVDDGDLSADGSRSVLSLDGCTDIANAKLYAGNTSGYAFYYATDNTVYSFSASSGQTTSNVFYECEDGETITAMYNYGSLGGGWPTSDCILWIATWNESTEEGKLLQYEIDVNYGIPYSYYGPMYAGTDENPIVTTGWGKIVGMTCNDAE